MDILYYIIALVIAVTVHEFFHAWTATYLGDPTPKYDGRLTLNPLAHFDIYGVLVFIISHFRFGWGKPVVWNPRNIKDPVLGGLAISLAGPFSNFLLALVFSIPVKYLPMENVVWPFFYIAFYTNLLLMVFNFLPIPPLDGSKIIMALFPRFYARYIEQYFNYWFFVPFILIFIENSTGRGIIGPFIFNAVEKIAFLIGVNT